MTRRDMICQVMSRDVIWPPMSLGFRDIWPQSSVHTDRQTESHANWQ